MKDPFDDLDRQIGAALRARALSRRRGARRLGLAAVAAGLAVSGGAVAATTLVSDEGAESQGRKIALQAVRDTARDPACRPPRSTGRHVLIPAAPRAEITRVLPALAHAPAGLTDAERRSLISPYAGPGAILAPSVRRLTLSGGVRLFVFVQQGVGHFATSDPAGCVAARRARAEELSADRTDAARAWARRRLGELRETIPGLQTLWAVTESGGSGSPVDDRRALRPGLLSSGGRPDGRSVYVGIARPGTVRMRVAAAKGRARRGIASSVVVRDGFWAVLLPRGTGPVRVTGVDGRGTATRDRVRLRG